MNTILYVLKTGSRWRQLPRKFPMWSAVYDYFYHGSGASAGWLQEAEEGRGGWKLPGHSDELGRGENKRPRSKLRGMDL